MSAPLVTAFVVMTVGVLAGVVTHAYLRTVRPWVVSLARRLTPSWHTPGGGQGQRVATVVAFVAFGAIALTSGAGVVELSEKLERGSPTVLTLDRAVHHWFLANADIAAQDFFARLGYFTGPTVLPWIVAAVAAVLVLLGLRRDALYLAVINAGCGVIIYGLKEYFARARPDLSSELVREASYSFPSGHSAIAVAVLGGFAYLLLRRENRPGRAAIVAALAAAAVALIAISRVFLGVHWLSDVAAGLLAGTCWWMGATLILRTAGSRMVQR